jgi:hypothetical protein
MASQRRLPILCPDCFFCMRGFKKVFCPGCGALSPTAGYAGRAARLRAQPAKPKKRARYGL